MGRLFTVTFESPEATADFYCCRGCFEDHGPHLSNSTHIALHSDYLFRATPLFCGKHACFFRKAVNVVIGEPETRNVCRSQCKVADLYCVRCCRLLGLEIVQLSKGSPVEELVKEGWCVLDRTQIDHWQGKKRLQPIQLEGSYLCP